MTEDLTINCFIFDMFTFNNISKFITVIHWIFEVGYVHRDTISAFKSHVKTHFYRMAFVNKHFLIFWLLLIIGLSFISIVVFFYIYYVV